VPQTAFETMGNPMAVRLVFVDETSIRTFDSFAEGQGWEREAADPDPVNVDADRPFTAWRTSSGRVVFTNDTVIETQYAEVGADDDETAIRGAFTVHNLAETVAALDPGQAENAVFHGYELIAGAAGETSRDQSVVDATTSGFADERARVRRAALLVVQYTEWTEFLPDVQRLAESDPDQNVRDMAGNMQMLLELS